MKNRSFNPMPSRVIQFDFKSGNFQLRLILVGFLFGPISLSYLLISTEFMLSPINLSFPLKNFREKNAQTSWIALCVYVNTSFMLMQIKLSIN